MKTSKRSGAKRYLRCDALKFAVDRLEHAYSVEVVQPLLDQLTPEIAAGHLSDLGDGYTVDSRGYEIHPGINLLEWRLKRLSLSKELARAIVSASKYAEHDNSQIECADVKYVATYCLARDLRGAWRRKAGRSSLVHRPDPPPEARTGCRSWPRSNVVQLFPAPQ